MAKCLLDIQDGKSIKLSNFIYFLLSYILMNNQSKDEKKNTAKALYYEKAESLKMVKQKGNNVILETDKAFIQSIQNICRNNTNIFDDIIGIKANNLTLMECDQIHFKGKLHRQANVVNVNSNCAEQDLKQNPQFKNLMCTCGCEHFKGNTYSIFYDIQDINILGSGILLMFLFLKSLVYNVLIFVLIYSIFAIVVNLMGTSYQVSPSSQKSLCQSEYCFFRDRISDYNKYNYNYISMIQAYLGLAGMTFWGIYARYIRNQGVNKNQAIDKSLQSASDFAIKIDDLPFGQYCEEDLLQYLQRLRQQSMQNDSKKVGDIQKNSTSHLQSLKNQEESGIQYIQIIYNMEFSRKMFSKITQLCIEVKKFMKPINSRVIILEKDIYMQKKKNLLQTYELYQDLRKKFLTDGEFRKKISTRTAIIKFNKSQGKNLFLNNYGTKNITLFKRIKEMLKQKLNGGQNGIIFKGSIPSISRAPEPSDIIWINCQKQYSTLRILGIYIITMIIILISFGIIVGLQYVQAFVASNTELSNSSITTVINILSALVLQIINKLLWISLIVLLDFQYNHTFSNKIISQMNKSSVLVWINIIILPIIVNYIISDRYYGANGLAGIVFDYHISAVSVNLLLKFIDPTYALIRIGLEIRCIRDYLIRARYQKGQSNYNQISKQRLYKIYSLYQGPQFDIAQAYVFISSNLMHAFFFCQLQPFILVLVLIQVFMFYWICKFKVLKVCKLPKFTEYLIFEVAIYQIMLIPIFYGVGSIFNSFIGNKINPLRQTNYIPAFICIGFGIVNYSNPKGILTIIFKKIATCYEQIKKQNAGDHKQKQSNLQKRREQYFKNSNSLSLLGFQNHLLGINNLDSIQKQLKLYCKSHILQNINQQDYDINFQMITKVLDKVKNEQNS